ncbi:MAG: methylornithine synthase PylB [Bacteroidota bacterium]
MANVSSFLKKILDNLLQGYPISKKDIKILLGLSDPDELNLLFNASCQVRARYFGTGIFLYGFLYFSTHCRNNCMFCHYRHTNTSIDRYRKTLDQILNAARQMTDTGVHLIDLTMGEDPEFYEFGKSGFKKLCAMVESVRKETDIPVMISPGTLPDNVLKDLADIGTNWYASYQETHNKELYNRLRSGQVFEERIAKKAFAKSCGMLIEEGLLTGIGETDDDLADSILWMKDFQVDQARVMTFVPQENTPMADVPPQGNLKEQIIIAAIRLVLGNVLIPASLDVDGLEGLKVRLNAGANVVTSIVPPKEGLAGVANNSLDIEESRRSIDHILPLLESCGLQRASLNSFLSWTGKRLNHY